MSASHWPKLVLITGARLWLTMYWAERSTPSVEFVEAEVTNRIVAFFATAPAHSTSRSASPSSPAPRSPGSGPLTTIWGGLLGSPIRLRNVVQLAAGGWVRPTIAIV